MTMQTPQPLPAVQYIDLREGMHLVFGSDYPITTTVLLELAWSCSAALGGKPVRCAGILPGVTLQVSTRLDLASVQPMFEFACDGAMAHLSDWIEVAEAMPSTHLPLPYSTAFVVQNPLSLAEAPALLLERRYVWP